jgi:hypothetical protein
MTPNEFLVVIVIYEGGPRLHTWGSNNMNIRLREKAGSKARSAGDCKGIGRWKEEARKGEYL